MHELAVHQVELEMQNDELRRVQLALEASRARYFDLYDLAPVGYLTASPDGLILEANLCAATLLGVARSALAKRPLSRYIVQAQQDIYYQCRQQVNATGVAQTCELQVLHSAGAAVWVSLALSCAQGSDGAPVLRMMLSDISARKLLDESLKESNLRLQSACLQADQANRAKSDFLSSMSHELRSPLNAILGFAQLLESGTPEPTPDQQASLQQILRGGWYLLTLINEILDLSLIESGKLNLSMEPVCLADNFTDCAAMIAPQAQHSGIRVSMAALNDPCFVQADRTRLKQVIVNLLSNAIKYNRTGGTVDITCRSPSAGRVRISVVDTGEGLSEQQLSQLFQPFNRLGQESGTQEGTGIGLVVCKRLVELMGGEIGVNSRPGIGSEFWFELNQAKPQQATDEHETPAPAPHAATLPALLYVEDNPANTELLEQLLARRSDLRLLKAGNGTSGIAMARMHQPAVILMDINLPGITGFQALKILQDDAATRHIPVLALSANAMPHDVDKGLAAGFLCYLTKPIKINALMQALDLALAAAKEPR
ncbi:MAG: response regulator [Gammaproteobacteria bacterium]|nr:response regulator [Gammaproteobacteria bacterium]MBU3997429.1 response regulator [Gammaproteobacteria bacterium]MBU4018125.1 response regulator [Gammaproteobacteria bacterium]MBU4080184.1 response regulator [Gammaproteobacteria bacterium]MBU4114166.1 response regulator [Gammaproteobacteria bacterium]